MSGVLVGISGHVLLPQEARLLAHPCVIGLVLFQENYQNRAQLSALIASVRAIRQDLIVSVDQEGGAVQRFLGDGFEPLPALLTFGQAYDAAVDQAARQAVLAQVTQSAFENARQLQACGIDLLLGPVADLHHASSAIIGQRERAFHADPDAVLALVNAYLDGLQQAGMVRGIIKHFPGHGLAELDSHIDYACLEGAVPDLAVFEALMQQTAERQPFGIMLAHVLYPNIDPNHVVGTSPVFQRMIRQRLGYKGFVMSDCLSMKGAHRLCAQTLLSFKTGKIGLESCFQACIQTLLECFAPYHNALILTHLNHLFCALFPQHQDQMPDDLTMLAIQMDALTAASLPGLSKQEHAFIQQIRCGVK